MGREVLANGRSFLEREGRLLERRLAATVFDGADPAGAHMALLAYQNADGGFGHGLEPDKRCPDSLPIDLECALDALIVSGWNAPPDPAGDPIAQVVLGACDWLESATSPEGAVPLATPAIEHHPRADHWSDWTYEAALNPTAGLVGRLHALGVRHPWLHAAAGWCWERLDAFVDGFFDGDAHTLVEVARFLESSPDRGRADAMAPHLRGWLPGLSSYRADPDDPGYGLTPLHFAPTPDSPWVDLVEPAVLDGHLQRMLRDQQDDGGWSITWDPPSAASALEWRGIETLRSLRTLAAYGRL